VTNSGVAAGTPTLTFALPAGVAFLSGTVDGGAGCSASGRVVVCRLSSLAPGSLSQARVRVAARTAGALVCLVSASSDPVDPVPGNNSATLVLGLRAATSRSPAGRSSGKTFRGTPRSDRIVGTAGDDVIRGLGGGDVLDGRAGRDKLYGGAGDDVLNGGPGVDAIFAGAGRDVVRVAAGSRDSVSCGTGRDIVFADRADAVSHDCEVVRRSAAGP
jgi:Ca2+-binding RTX toxin-like protein